MREMLIIIIANWLSIASLGDFNNDGIVNFQDYAIVLSSEWTEDTVIWGAIEEEYKANLRAFLDDYPYRDQEYEQLVRCYENSFFRLNDWSYFYLEDGHSLYVE